MTEYYRGDQGYRDSDIFQIFIDKMNTGEPKSILEVGVAQSQPGRSTHSMGRFDNLNEYVKSDFVDDGADVDVVADIHQLEDTFEASRFDGFVARFVYEHVEKPWLASASINRILKLGGLAHIHTHLTFPIHGYPNDYFRFTTDGLVSLFDDSFGFRTLACDFQSPCALSFVGGQKAPEVWDEYAAQHRNYLDVLLVAEKVADYDS
jgi:hypothetical protein